MPPPSSVHQRLRLGPLPPTRRSTAGGSFVCCPPSLFLATAAVGIGSSGTTSDQLLQALRLDNWSIDTELASLLAVLTRDRATEHRQPPVSPAPSRLSAAAQLRRPLSSLVQNGVAQLTSGPRPTPHRSSTHFWPKTASTNRWAAPSSRRRPSCSWRTSSEPGPPGTYLSPAN